MLRGKAQDIAFRNHTIQLGLIPKAIQVLFLGPPYGNTQWPLGLDTGVLGLTLPSGRRLVYHSLHVGSPDLFREAWEDLFQIVL